MPPAPPASPPPAASPPPPPPPPAPPLQDKAVKDAQRHVKTFLAGDILVEPISHELDWHEKDNREVYDQHMVLWCPYGDFDVFLDADGKPTGFFDKCKLAPCEYKALPAKTILEMAVATGFIPATGRVLSQTKGPADCLEAVVAADGTQVDAPRYLVRINPKLQRVISITPEGVSP